MCLHRLFVAVVNVQVRVLPIHDNASETRFETIWRFESEFCLVLDRNIATMAYYGLWFNVSAQHSESESFVAESCYATILPAVTHQFSGLRGFDHLCLVFED